MYAYRLLHEEETLEEAAGAALADMGASRHYSAFSCREIMFSTFLYVPFSARTETDPRTLSEFVSIAFGVSLSRVHESRIPGIVDYIYRRGNALIAAFEKQEHITFSVFETPIDGERHLVVLFTLDVVATDLWWLLTHIVRDAVANGYNDLYPLARMQCFDSDHAYHYCMVYSRYARAVLSGRMPPVTTLCTGIEHISIAESDSF